MHSTEKNTLRGRQQPAAKNNSPWTNPALRPPPPGPENNNTDNMSTKNDKMSEFRSARHYTHSEFIDKKPDGYIPEWVDVIKDNTCYYQTTEIFWYQTEDDYQNGMSNCQCYEDTEAVRRTYTIGRYGDLPIMLIGEEAWVAIGEIASLIGCSNLQITGYISEDEYSVRGEPGHLVPDGIRNIYPHTCGGAIRLEAAIRCCELNNVRAEIINYLQCEVLPAVYAGRELNDSLMIRIDPGSVVSSVKINVGRNFDECYGAVLGFRYGSHMWLQLLGLSMRTVCAPEFIAKIAGKGRLLACDGLAVHNSLGGKYAATYVRSDVVGALVGGRAYEFATVFAWSKLLPLKLEKWLPPADSSASVGLAVLYQILQPSARFESWIYELEHRFTTMWPLIDEQELMAIPAGLARDIAQAHGGFVGRMVAYLVADGGYFHGGSLAETPDQTLHRFRGLAPDEHGHVEARKVWEFLNCPYAYDDWLEYHTLIFGKDDPVTNGMVNAAGQWCYEVRHYTTSLPVDFRIEV